MTIKEQVYAACEHEMNNRLNFFERVLINRFYENFDYCF